MFPTIAILGATLWLGSIVGEVLFLILKGWDDGNKAKAFIVVTNIQFGAVLLYGIGQGSGLVRIILIVVLTLYLSYFFWGESLHRFMWLRRRERRRKKRAEKDCEET